MGKLSALPIHIADGVNPTEGLLHAIVCKYQARSNEFGIMPSANLSRNAIRGKDADSIYVKVAHSWNRGKYKKVIPEGFRVEMGNSQERDDAVNTSGSRSCCAGLVPA